jgi:hypothetical protein
MEHAKMPLRLYEYVFRHAVDLALSGDKEMAQWVVDEMILRDLISKRAEFHARNNAGEYDGLKGKPCAICGKPSDTLDHIVPLKMGGTNDLSNIQPLCRKCNSVKGDR